MSFASSIDCVSGHKRQNGSMTLHASEPRVSLAIPFVRRRPEQPEDAPFRLALFRQTQGALLGGLEPALVDVLLRQQIVGQAMTYAAAYPEAQYDIVECDGVPIGRMVVSETSEAVTLVDIALLADRRGRGLGTRLLADLISTADATGRVVRLSVDPANVGARRLYERLGFVVTAASQTSLAMERRAGPLP